MGQSILSNEIVKSSVPFIDIQDFSPLIESCKDKQIVMLGESTHGTREFYEWRNLISCELIRNHGFNFIAVEGDWPACEEVNKFVRRKSPKSSFQALSSFFRWPTWMWANDEIVKLMDWLWEWNAQSELEVGFHGLDVYSLFESINEIVTTLEQANPELALRVRDDYSCFDTYHQDEKVYARSLFTNPAGCASQVARALTEILHERLSDEELYFNIKQNAKVIKNAESYYRSLVFQDQKSSWNLRDEHMLETLQTLLRAYGPKSKAIVWAHNSHVGDYRGTDMVLKHQVSLGGLARQTFGEENVSLVGFTTYSGNVTASHAWGGHIEVMDVPEAKDGSVEEVLHSAIPFVGHPDFFLSFTDIEEGSPFLDYRGQRAIGVVYDPRHEERRNYVPTSLAYRYDHLVFINATRSLSALGYFAANGQIPESYPTGDVP